MEAEMSNITLSPNASGSGVFTIAAPNSNTNRTLTLPDNTGTILTAASTPAFASTIGVGGATAAASGAGITFPATASASSDANTLDDYEEGTWTPTVLFSTSNGDRSYFYQVGRYVKIGNLVHVQGYLQFSESTASGNLTIGGLPFTSSSVSLNYSSGAIYGNSLTGLSGQIQFLIDSSATSMIVYYSGTGSRTQLTNSNTGSSSDFSFSVCYQT
jgi:hypothetical protein